MKVSDLSVGLTLISSDWLIVTLLEKLHTGMWLCLIVADFYLDGCGDESCGYTTPITFRRDTVEDEGWRVL